jgi:hypothetical protein
MLDMIDKAGIQQRNKFYFFQSYCIPFHCTQYHYALNPAVLAFWFPLLWNPVFQQPYICSSWRDGAAAASGSRLHSMALQCGPVFCSHKSSRTIVSTVLSAKTGSWPLVSGLLLSEYGFYSPTQAAGSSCAPPLRHPCPFSGACISGEKQASCPEF